MAKFKWSASFWQLNGAYLAEYAACADGTAVIAKQQQFMAELEAEAAARVRRSCCRRRYPVPTSHRVARRARVCTQDAAKSLAQNEYGSNWGLPSSSEEEYEYESAVPAAAGGAPQQVRAQLAEQQPEPELEVNGD